MALIFVASSLPASATGPDTPEWTLFLKMLHFVNFGILGLLILAAVKGGRSLSEAGRNHYLLSLLFTVLYAVSDEYHQKFSPGRHPSVRDVVIDSLGASVFLSLCLLTAKKRSRNCRAGKEP